MAMAEMIDFSDKIDLPDIQLLLTCLRWPSEFVFPCLDLVRLIVLNLNAMKTLTSIEETASGCSLFIIFVI